MSRYSAKQIAWRLFSFVCGTDRHPNILHPRWLLMRQYQRVVLAQRQFVCGQVLDVGCGDRYFEKAFGGYYTRYVGFDYPDTRVACFGESEMFGAPDVAGDGRHLPFAPQTFDTVFLFEVLEHCPEPSQILAEIHAVMKKDGRLILSVPAAIAEHGQPHDYYRYTQFGLRYLLHQAGFVVEHLVQIGRLGTIITSHINYSLVEGTFSRRSTSWRWCVALLLPLVLIVWVGLNLFGWVLDKVCGKMDFVMNHCIVARKN